MGPKTAYPDIQLGFRPLYFERYQTEHNFEMLLVKWKSLSASGGPFQTSNQGENTSSRNLNNIDNNAATDKD